MSEFVFFNSRVKIMIPSCQIWVWYLSHVNIYDNLKNLCAHKVGTEDNTSNLTIQVTKFRVIVQACQISA